MVWKAGILFFLILGCFRSSLAGAEGLRVELFSGRPALTEVEVRGAGLLESRRGRRSFSGEVTIAAAGDALLASFASSQVSGDEMLFLPAQAGAPLSVGGKRYRGNLRLSSRAGKLLIVNEVGLEDYLRGVVPNEMFRGREAFRVQAIISRTFALYVRDIERRHARGGFDICDGNCCQVYRGYDSEDTLANQAANSTRGEVLLYRGKPILAAYDANAGGQTCTVDEAWPGSLAEKFPYLRSLASPDDVAALTLKGFESCYQWQVSFSWKELLARLGLSAEEIGRPLEARVATGPSGRVAHLVLRGTAGEYRLERPETIRRKLGLRSVRFRLDQQGDQVRLLGFGNGHGVGLSQQGAYGMAKRGMSYRQILAYYYPGAELAELHTTGLPAAPSDTS